MSVYSKSITSACCAEDTPEDTLVHTLIHDKYSPACLVSDRKVKGFRVILWIALSRLVYCLLI